MPAGSTAETLVTIDGYQATHDHPVAKPSHPCDTYLDLPPTPRTEPLVANTPENPIIEKAATEMTDAAKSFVIEELIPRNIPFPPSEKYAVVFSIIDYQQEHGRWTPQLLVFDGTQFKTCSATLEPSDCTYSLGALTDAAPRVVVKHAEDVFYTISTLLENREGWLKEMHELTQAMKVHQALERSKQTMRRLNSISKQALEASVSV